jgi:acetate kinase
MPRVLVVNAGSSTLKLAVVGDDDHVEATQELDPWDGGDPSAAFAELLDAERTIDGIGHRIVHGGARYIEATLVRPEVRSDLAALVPLAPLHQPRALAALDAAMAALPDQPHVACFDTAFHATMSPAARTYALPAAWRARWPLQRYGFHGLSHAWVARRAPELVGPEGTARTDLRIVSCHLGAGASLCAIRSGRSVDTTMGFTPLDGLVMATRSGSVDPGLVLWLLDTAGLDVEDVRDGLEHRGGLAGLSGTSGDMREVLEARSRGNPDAALAFDAYVHRLRREIGAMIAALDGIDVLAFTGGIGEHGTEVRAAVADGSRFAGISIDPERNEDASGDTDLTAPGASVSTVVVTAREDLEIARQVRRTIPEP